MPRCFWGHTPLRQTGFWKITLHTVDAGPKTGVVEVDVDVDMVVGLEIIVGTSVSGFCDVGWHGFSILHGHLHGLQSSLHPHR